MDDYSCNPEPDQEFLSVDDMRHIAMGIVEDMCNSLSLVEFTQYGVGSKAHAVVSIDDLRRLRTISDNLNRLRICLSIQEEMANDTQS